MLGCFFSKSTRREEQYMDVSQWNSVIVMSVERNNKNLFLSFLLCHGNYVYTLLTEELLSFFFLLPLMYFTMTLNSGKSIFPFSSLSNSWYKISMWFMSNSWKVASSMVFWSSIRVRYPVGLHTLYRIVSCCVALYFGFHAKGNKKIKQFVVSGEKKFPLDWLGHSLLALDYHTTMAGSTQVMSSQDDPVASQVDSKGKSSQVKSSQFVTYLSRSCRVW